MRTSKYHHLIRINLLTCLIAAFSFGLTIQAKAQSEKQNALLQMIGNDRATIDAIAGYDEKVQNNILQVSKTPEVLNKIEELQKRSQSQFRAIINDYDRDAQTAFYEMARYPNLINEIVSNGQPSASEIDRIITKYPEDIHTTAKSYAIRYFDVLVRIDRLNGEIDAAFQDYLEPYEPETRESVNALLAYPEIVSVLVEDKDFTVLLGQVYNEDPEWAVRRLAEISKDLAEQNKEDVDAYKNQITSDPDAYKEMLDASENFARENNEVRSLEPSSDPVVEVRVVNSYPYWFGYPYWYSDPYWRPRPFYYHTGFYRNNFGAVVFVGLPSYHFLHWQTYYHPTRYPHLSYNYYNYYENHYRNRYPNSHSYGAYNGFSRSIERNVINNPRVNNSSLQRIDRERGTNIVRRPDPSQSGSLRRGNGDMNRPNNSYVRPSTGTNRGYNTVNPRRSEGAVNRRGAVQQSGAVRREATPANVRPNGSSTERSGQRSAIPPQRSENPAPGNQAGRSQTRREAVQTQRSAPPIREAHSATTRSSRRLEQRETKVNNQSVNKKAARESGENSRRSRRER